MKSKIYEAMSAFYYLLIECVSFPDPLAFESAFSSEAENLSRLDQGTLCLG